nr:glycerophosphodiester phosphodiesterase family protein [Alsobacter ponti]
MLRRRKSDPAFLRANLRAALAARAACEVDLVLTRDGHALCLHDLTLDAETTGSGPVAAATRAQVERLRQRAPDGTPLAEPPLFLDEVVDIVRASGVRVPALVQLDVKVPREALDAAAARRIGDTLGRDAALFVAGGCDWDAIRDLAEAAAGLAAGYDPLGTYPRGFDLDDAGFRSLGERTYATAPDAAIFYLEASLLLAGLARGVNVVPFVTRNGAMVDAWTVDADRPGLASVLARLVAAGCGQITSNDPDLLAPLLAEAAA